MGVNPESSIFKSRTKRFPDPVTISSVPSHSPASSPKNGSLIESSLLEPSSTHSSSLHKPHPGHLYTSGMISAPSIPSSGMKNYDDGLQIGFGVESAASILSSARPQTAGNLNNPSATSSSGSLVLEATKRAQSASSIVRSRAPGHTFSRHVRDTTGSLINNVDAISVSHH